MHKHREIYWKVALRILTYIKRSSCLGLLYKKYEHLRIEVFSDSNYARDKKDRKSTSNYCTYIEAIWLRGGVRSRVLCLVLVLKLSIER